MSTFLNLYVDKPTPTIYIKRHSLYAIIWVLDISIFILRLDSDLFNYLNIDNNFLRTVVPFLLIVVNFFILFKQKWYYNLAFIFYPFLLIFWFVPKLILERGKLYLLLYYMEGIFGYLSKFKKSLVNSTVLILMIMVLSTIDNKYVRVLGVLYSTYLFFKILYKHILGSLKKGDQNSNKKPSSLSKLDLIDTLEKYKDDDKLSVEQNVSNKIKRMILWNYFLEYISKNINGYRGKRAFMIVWFFKYFLFFFLTIFYYTFLNYQLFKIDFSNFLFTTVPNLFDFLYYTFKNVTFSNIDSLKPNSIIAKIIEISSFFILSIYFLIITISSLLSLKMSEYSKDVEDAVTLCKRQNEKIEIHLKSKYNTDISKALSEIENIQTPIVKLRGILERIL
jgi:hypothetical protein